MTDLCVNDCLKCFGLAIGLMGDIMARGRSLGPLYLSKGQYLGHIPLQATINLIFNWLLGLILTSWIKQKIGDLLGHYGSCFTHTPAWPLKGNNMHSQLIKVHKACL